MSLLFILIITSSKSNIITTDYNEPIVFTQKSLTYQGNRSHLFIIHNSSSFNDSLYSLRIETNSKITKDNVVYTLYQKNLTNISYCFLNSLEYDETPGIYRTFQYGTSYNITFYDTINNDAEFVIFKIDIDAQKKILNFDVYAESLTKYYVSSYIKVVLIVFVSICFCAVIINIVICAVNKKKKSNRNEEPLIAQISMSRQTIDTQGAINRESNSISNMYY